MNSKLNVLIVEDEPLIAIFIKQIVLGMNENLIGICYNSDDAIAKIQSEKPDLIFMDINIEGSLDGISVLRKVEMTHNPTVFFVSAYSDKETIAEALSLNPYNYIIKPIKEQDIEIAITLARKKQKKILPQLKEHIVFSNELYYDVLKQELYLNNKPFLISGIDRRLLMLFMENINLNLTLDVIKTEIWEEKEVSNNTIRDAVSNLRKKLPQLNIQTNFGRGYILIK